MNYTTTIRCPHCGSSTIKDIGNNQYKCLNCTMEFEWTWKDIYTQEDKK